MKKLIALALVLSLGTFVGCDSKKKPAPAAAPADGAAAPAGDGTAPADGAAAPADADK